MIGLPLTKINYFYVIFTILWSPLRLAFFNIDGMGRIVFFVTIIVFLLNLALDDVFRRSLTSKPVVFWLLWIIFSSINLLFKGYYEEQPFLFFIVLRLIQPFLVMCLVMSAVVLDTKRIMTLLTVIYFIYGVLSVTFLGGQGSLEEDRIIGQLGNVGPLTTIFLIFFTSLMHINYWLNLKIFFPLMLFALFVPTIAATRKAVTAAIIMIMFWTFGNFKFKLKNVFLILLIAVAIKIGYDNTMDKLLIGSRFIEAVDEGEHYNTTDIEVLNFLGDRVIQYINGWELFVNNPITGIGLRNYFHTTDSEYVLHSEYMVQLAESGLIGTFLYFGFNFWIAFSLIWMFRSFRNKRKEAIILFGGFLSILFINVTAWTYDFPGVFVVYGVIIGFVNKTNFEIALLKYESKKNNNLDPEN